MGIRIRNLFYPGSGVENFVSEIWDQHPESATTLDKMNKNYFKCTLILILETTKTLLYILGCSVKQSSTALIIYLACRYPTILTRSESYLDTKKNEADLDQHIHVHNNAGSHRYHIIQIYSYVSPRKHWSKSVKEKINN
jgi:hypothetical protein